MYMYIFSVNNVNYLSDCVVTLSYFLKIKLNDKFNDIFLNAQIITALFF